MALLHVADRPRFFVPRRTPDGELLEANPHSPWGALPFEPMSFAASKPRGTQRIFCVGESTANGFPYARHSSFAKWLRVRLATLLPDTACEVVKMGYDAKSAPEIADLCDEIVDYQPDLVILYAGHNQFLPQNLGPVRHPWQDRARQMLAKLRLARWLMDLMTPSPTDREAPAKSGPRTIDDQPYLSAAEHATGYHLYRAGLERIRDACRSHGVRLLACVPASNLRDYAPNKSHWSERLLPAQRAELHELRRRGCELLEQGDARGAAALLAHAVAADASPALLHYDLARALDRQGDARAALEHYQAARELDDLPNRATSQIVAILAATLAPAQLADCAATFAAAARDGIPGSDLFVDNCHPELRAQKLIADAIVASLATDGWPRPRLAWQFEAEPSVEEYWRRMGLSLPRLTTDFATDAITNLIQLLGRVGDVELAASTEDALRFGLRYDGANPTALLGLALAAALRGQVDVAARLLEESRAADPAPAQRLFDLARGHERLDRLLRPLRKPEPWKRGG